MLPSRSIRLKAAVALLASAAAMSPPVIYAQNSGGTGLAGVIAELNAAATRFHGAQADFNWDQYEAVVQADETQSGVIYFARRGDTTVMAADIQEADGQPAPKFVVYDGSELQFYQPQIKQMTIFHAGNDRNQVESFLTLGFGGSGDDLQANWNLNLLGMETMNGVRVAKLDLTPKAAKIQQMFLHVTIWVDPSKGISQKQIFYEPSGDRRTVTYTNIQYNGRIDKSVFHIKTAPGTTVQTRR